MSHSAKACKVCHGPLATALALPSAPKSRSPLAGPAVGHGSCHAHCASFACPGCVAKEKPLYSILDLKNEVYDFQCSDCMAEVAILPPSRRGSAASDATQVGIGADLQAVF